MKILLFNLFVATILVLARYNQPARDLLARRLKAIESRPPSQSH